MTHPLAEDYLNWLEPQVRNEHDGSGSTYWGLLELMYAKEFVWLIANDDNRVQDGLDLRAEFCHARHIHSGALQDLGACSFLEVLIGLSRRLAFMAGSRSSGWAWQLIQNLELHRLVDPVSRRKLSKADEILEVVIWRTYAPDGQGGFFPLIDAEEDQTQVELWYQMAAYVNELHPEY